jgi:excisionase family DNA binding protein
MLALLDQADKPFAASGPEAAIAKVAADRLRAVAEAKQDIKITVAGESNIVVPLPARAVALILRLLDTMSEEIPISIIPHNATLTTQQAADYLNVSRPFLIKIIENDGLPYSKVGTHRRIKFSDILEYERADKAKQLEAVKTLNEEARRLGLD